MFRIILVAAISILIVSCESNNYTGPEARKWLLTNKNQYALATSRFGKNEIALDFVNLLYEKGAIEVAISDATIMGGEERIAKEGGPYADGLVVTLPTDPNKRSELLEIFTQEAKRSRPRR